MFTDLYDVRNPPVVGALALENPEIVVIVDLTCWQLSIIVDASGV